MRGKLGIRWRGRWAWGLVLWLFLTGACWPAQRPEGRRHGAQRERTSVTVEQGRLSVDLRQADMQTVLAHIGEQAGIAIFVGSMDRRTISAQFAGVDLEQGLRRLLRLASLDYLLLYARESTGAVTLREVRVFAEEQGERSPKPLAAEREERAVAVQELTDSAEDASQRFAAALTQAMGAFGAPPADAGHEVARSLRAALEQARNEASPNVEEGEEEEGKMVHRFRKALQQQLR